MRKNSDFNYDSGAVVHIQVWYSSLPGVVCCLQSATSATSVKLVFDEFDFQSG